MAFSELRTIERPGGDRPTAKRASGGAWLQSGQSPPTMLGWRFPAEFRIRPAGWPATQESPPQEAEAVPASPHSVALDAGLGVAEPSGRQDQAAFSEQGHQTSYL